jgi:8-oxo-dGTP pyrophosphatase MutT (NUDIX family)
MREYNHAVSGPTLERVKHLLRAHKKRTVPIESHMRKAAVAAVFREAPELELLLIRRAEHPHDPWSGHMAFPGGRVDATDSGPLGAVVRETREEVALDLDRQGQLVGELSHVPALAHGRPVPMVIYPFVFELTGEAALQLDRSEVQEALWVPFSFLLEDRNRRFIEKKIAGVSMKLPAYHLEDRILWGLTLKMIDELLDLVRQSS